MGKRILLGGATGLVGQGVVRVLLQCDQVEAVSVLVPRPFTALDPRVQALQLTDYSTTRWTVWICAAWTPACIAAISTSRSPDAYQSLGLDPIEGA